MSLKLAGNPPSYNGGRLHCLAGIVIEISISDVYLCITGLGTLHEYHVVGFSIN